MTLTDVTIVPVRTDKKSVYLEFSARIGEVYREYGALRIVDCWHTENASDDGNFHAADAMENYATGGLPNMRELACAREDETVVVSFTEWPSREVRDRAVKAIAVDPRIQATTHEEPVFDGKRLIAGGFEVESRVR